MKIDLEINNTTNSPFERGFFEVVAEKTFAELRYDFLENKKVAISLAMVAPEEIRKLNKEYRKYDSVTDILSFPEYENAEQIKKVVAEKSDGELFLGELILCYDDIKEYVAREGLEIKGELANVMAHGILHLLGFEHGEEMFKIQNKVKDYLI
jgi:probable rRNA maturation factor